MASFFGRLKSHTGTPNAAPAPSQANTTAAATASPLEQLLAGAGPIRDDGSDKFFGMHNPSNTCYCNSVVQCLYFSEPFREQVISFPSRLPRELASRPRPPSSSLSSEAAAEAPAPPLSYPAAKPINEPYMTLSPRKAPQLSPPPPTPILSPPENKESFDYMKKQALVHGPNLRMEHANYEVYGMPESLFTGLKDIFEAVVAHDSRTGIVTPAKFLDVLRRNFEFFRSPMHQDAHEFLNLLLNEVVDQVESFSKKKSAHPAVNGTLESASTPIPHGAPQNSTSWVHELFEGTLTSETRCLTCETVSRRDEVFLDLSVDLEEHSSVTSCLRKFSQEEMLCERNKFHCDRCGGLQEAEKRMKIKRLPRILALHLKRFKYVEEVGHLQKLFHRVMFPFHLRLLNTTDDAEDPDRLYELYAIIVHLGSTPFHGHYVSIIKTRDKGWLLFDDELVLPVDKDYVRNYFGGDPRNPACAYVLFYQQTTPDAMAREQENDESLEDGVQQDAPNIDGGSTTLHTTERSPTISAADAAPPQSPFPEDPVDLPILAPSSPALALHQPTSLNSRHEVRRTLPRLSTQGPLGPAPEREARPVSSISDGASHHHNSLQRSDLGLTEDVASGGGRDAATGPAPGAAPKSSGGGLSRFRTTSLSMSRRSRFWGGPAKDAKTDGGSPVQMESCYEEAAAADGAAAAAPLLLDSRTTPATPASPSSADKDRQPRSARFGLGLGRKKSNLPPASGR